MKFWKYTSAGNDFVIFDNVLDLKTSEIVHICDRRFGIGADGVLVFKDSKEFDFEMVYFNADGGEVEMCGNGARALCHYAKNIKNIDNNILQFKTRNGVYKAEFLPNKLIKMEMSEISQKEILLDGLSDGEISYIEVGVPHVVLLNQGYDESLAKKIRYDQRFSHGVNVNFVQKLSENKYEVRTFERGVEGETLACGTGITAVGICILQSHQGSSVEIKARGGDFLVEKESSSFFLTGATTLVFSGELEDK